MTSKAKHTQRDSKYLDLFGEEIKANRRREIRERVGRGGGHVDLCRV